MIKSNHMTSKTYATLGIFLLLLSLTACSQNSGGDVEKKQKQEAPAPITNRIDVPPAVRRNLGITFAKVERRNVATTIRVPGQFEMIPKAHREYHATLSGRIELLVNQYDRIEPGMPMYRIDSPQWRAMQQTLSETAIVIRKAKQQLAGMDARLATIDKHAARLLEQETVWVDRIKQVGDLINAGGGAASELTEARSQLANTRTSMAEVDEEHATAKQQRIEIESQLLGYQQSMPLMYADALSEKVKVIAGQPTRIDLALTPAAAMLGLSVDELRKNVGSEANPLPYWRTIDQVEFKAQQSGIVESQAVTNGAWVDASSLVLTSVDASQIRFRAIGLQADLGRLRDGMTVEIIPPRGGVQSLSGSVKGQLTLGLEADALQRTIDLIMTPVSKELPAWARRGVSAEMEVVLDQTAAPSLAVPNTAVISDGLDRVLFRRDPKDPNKVIRLEADLGLTDGRWIVVESGLTDGDEVVHHGVYELMLASGSGKQKGGHFHADGTFHPDGEHD